MGIFEVWILIVAQQALQAGAAFCAFGQTYVSNKMGQAGFNYGGQFLKNMAALAGYGSTAAQAEFATKTTAETAFATAAKGLPTIT